MNGPKILALIVAYNQPEAINRCLRALHEQTRPVDGVLIVDNSEELGGTVIEGPPGEFMRRVRVLRSGANTGPAGGFAKGFSTFQEESEWTHLWPMDDDCYPERLALEKLLATVPPERLGVIAFLPALNEESGQVTAYPGWGHAPLIDRCAVHLGGIPRADLFWWIEDTEYLQNRLPRAGVQVVRSHGAYIRYDLPRRANGKSCWKYYYEVRNTIWYRLYVQRLGVMPLLKLLRSIFKLFTSSLIASESRSVCIEMCLRGLVDGFSGRLGANVKPPGR